MEFHFHTAKLTEGSIEVVMDRFPISEAQRANLQSYLGSGVEVPLARRFAIPDIEHLTIADSRYVGGLQVAHVLCEVLRDIANSRDDAEAVAKRTLSVASFLGRQMVQEETGAADDRKK